MESVPAEPPVELTHLKMPAAPVGPITVVHDHASGYSRASDAENEVLDLLAVAGDDGVTPPEVARDVFGRSKKPSRRRLAPVASADGRS